MLKVLLCEGKIIRRCNQDLTAADLEEFARDMVAEALPVFTKAVFKAPRRWSPARSALRTYLCLGSSPPENPSPAAATSKLRDLRVTGLAEQPETPDVGQLIRDFNAQNPQREELWTRVLHAVDTVRHAREREQVAAAAAKEARQAHAAIQAEHPQRRASRASQLAIGGLTLMLDAVACNFAAQALSHNQLQSDAWTALFLAVLAGGAFALDHYRDRSRKVWRAVAAGLAGFVTGLGVLRYSYLITVGADSSLAALVGAALFTAATGVFVAAGYWALRRAETPQAVRCPEAGPPGTERGARITGAAGPVLVREGQAERRLRGAAESTPAAGGAGRGAWPRGHRGRGPTRRSPPQPAVCPASGTTAPARPRSATSPAAPHRVHQHRCVPRDTRRASGRESRRRCVST